MLVDADARRPGRCRSCGRAVEWVLLANGAWHPFDPPLVLLARQPSLFDGQELATVDTAKSPSHFATCPHAALHRRSS